MTTLKILKQIFIKFSGPYCLVILSIFAFLKESPGYEHPYITSISSFKEALPFLDHLPPNTLVIFDLDETLIAHHPDPIPPTLRDPLLPEIIKKLQTKNIKTIALAHTKTFLTQATPFQEEERYKALLRRDIDFKNSFQDFFVFDEFPRSNGYYPIFSKGILYTNLTSKGLVLNAFLEHVIRDFKPTLIVFFDTYLDPILDVRETAEERNIPYKGFLYMKPFDEIGDDLS